MELLLLGLLPVLAFGIFGSNDDDDDKPAPREGNPEDQILRDDNGESVIDGGDGIDLLLGAGGPDELSGDAGMDILVGETGQDTLSGGDDDDLLLGGWGIDLLSGDDGDDIVIGGAREDELFGGAGDDLLVGSSGADTLSGDEGDDDLVGLEVRDQLSPENLVDLDTSELTASLETTFGDALADSDVNRVLNGLINSEPDDIAADSLFGGAGADILAGDNGDAMYGGADEDSFTSYREDGDEAPTIVDFDAANEELEILINGPVGAGLTYQDTEDGLAVRVQGTLVVVLEGVLRANLVPGSISVQSVAT